MPNRIHIENITARNAPDNNIIKMVNWILQSEGQKNPWNITFVFVDNEFIIQQNQNYFQKSTPTDVISFNLSDSPTELEGEVYISIEMAQAQAADYDVSLENELLRLAAHGTLHLLNYDDATVADKQRMTALENKALAYIYSNR